MNILGNSILGRGNSLSQVCWRNKEEFLWLGGRGWWWGLGRKRERERERERANSGSQETRGDYSGPDKQ
jgi:hypothetical protein